MSGEEDMTLPLWLRMATHWWFALTMPNYAPPKTLRERERLRKARLYCIFLFYTVIFITVTFLDFALSHNPQVWAAILMMANALLGAWLNKRGRIGHATTIFLSGCIVIISWGLGLTATTSPLAFVWQWVLLLIVPMLASMFLPFLVPIAFAGVESVIIVVIFFMKHYQHLLAPAAQVDFFVFMFITMYAIAILSAVHAHSVHTALRESDRAAELEQARDDLAVANARLEGLATLDPVTGLLNQRALQARLPIAVADAERAGTLLAIIFADLDHFKHVNDTWGHKVGDIALAHLATCLRENVRAADIVARYGGEEFVVVLPEHNQIDAAQMAERLRALVAATPVILPDGQPIAITLSLGVAIFPDDGRAIADILSAADAAMYCAKRAGRNRVCLAAQIDASAAA